MTKWLQIAAKLAVVLCCSVVVAQDGADLLDDFASEVEVLSSDSIESAADLDVDALAADADDVKILNVRLQDNGKLSGRLQVYYPTGKSEPADAKVAFTQSGQLVSSTRTDDMGHFHVEGLEPGDYTATASVGEASTDFQVKVLAFDENAAPEEMFLEGTLTPIPGEIVGGEMIASAGGCVDCGCSTCGGEIIQDDVVVNEGIVYDEGFVDEGVIVDEGCTTCGDEGSYVVEETFTPDMGCGCSAPVSSGFSSCGACGGGGGGGGGFGGRGLGLLGIGGLAAGITALAIDDDTPVSPAAP